MPSRPRDSPTALLDAARRGDERAFHDLVAPHRGALQAHCYRMLGSLQDAEDAVQETLLRAWRALPRFEGRSSLRSWLYTIATNVSLKAIERRRKRVLPVDYGPPADPHADPEPLTESIWIEPYPDAWLSAGDASPESRYEQRESVELAFIAAAQHLPPRQRAVLLLREVLGFSAAEVAASIETTVAAVNSALQRARKTIGERLPAQSQQATLRALGDARVRELVEAYMDAWERSDIDAVVGLLAEDAIIAMPPTPAWMRGHADIRVFYEELVLAGLRWLHLPTSANGQPAVGCYAWNDDVGGYVATVLDVLTLDESHITEITSFVSADVFARFGLPAALPA